jgi:hypothetical protein
VLVLQTDNLKDDLNLQEANKLGGHHPDSQMITEQDLRPKIRGRSSTSRGVRFGWYAGVTVK